MKIDIDFDEILNKVVNRSIDASVALSDKNRDSSVNYEKIQLIAHISAATAVDVLREYHDALENSLSTFLDKDAATR